MSAKASVLCKHEHLWAGPWAGRISESSPTKKSQSKETASSRSVSHAAFNAKDKESKIQAEEYKSVAGMDTHKPISASKPYTFAK